MAARLNKYQFGNPQTMNGYIGTDILKKYWLGSKMCEDPEGSSEFIVNLLAANRGPSFESLLKKYPIREFEDDSEITWKIVGSELRNIPLVEARTEDNTVITSEYPTNIGIGGDRFYLVFSENYFGDQEFIEGEMSYLYKFRIIESPFEEGSNYVYKVELSGNNQKYGVPVERLLPGERFSKDAPYVEDELSRGGGTLNFSKPVSMRNDWSTIRLNYKVGGNAIGLRMPVGVPMIEEDGKEVVKNMWISQVEYKFEKQFSDYKNNALLYGVSNINENHQYVNVGVSGNPIKTSSGLFEQIEVSHTYYYNNPKSVFKLILNAVMDLADNSLDLDQREFVINTGTRGALVLHEGMCQQINSWVPFKLTGDNIGLVSKVKNVVNQNSLSAGFQMVEYHGPNGIVLKVNVDRMYDNKIKHPILMPNSDGGIAMSYRFDIMFAGASNGSEADSNIQICRIKGPSGVEARGYKWGPRNPFTNETFNMNMGQLEDSCIMSRMAKLALIVKDPTRVISVVPQVLLG